jgi:hypothetical protein
MSARLQTPHSVRAAGLSTQATQPRTTELASQGFGAHDAAPLWLVPQFDPVSLQQLDAKASMLERLDNKYVVDDHALRQAIPELARHFDILQIDGKREFTYQTCYFDDPQRTSYFDHHRGRRKRCKVRVRKYLEAQLCFVEVKLKDKRGVTVKKRLKYALDKYGMLDAAAWAHIRTAYGELYGGEFGQALEPAVEMRYRRITLVAKDGGERMTIDRALVFSGDAGSCTIDPGMCVVETKSANANGIADKILRALHQHPTRRCSKYCVAMATLQAVHKHNRFLPALRKLGAVPGVAYAGRTSAHPALHRAHRPRRATAAA